MNIKSTIDKIVNAIITDYNDFFNIKKTNSVSEETPKKLDNIHLYNPKNISHYYQTAFATDHSIYYVNSEGVLTCEYPARSRISDVTNKKIELIGGMEDTIIGELEKGIPYYGYPKSAQILGDGVQQYGQEVKEGLRLTVIFEKKSSSENPINFLVTGPICKITKFDQKFENRRQELDALESEIRPLAQRKFARPSDHIIGTYK